MRAITDSSGRAVIPGTKLGGGGEGAAFTAGGGRVVKLLGPNARSAERKAKLEFMIDNPPQTRQAGQTVIAWPESLVFDGGSFVGFLMPEVLGTPLGDLLIPGQRAQSFPDADVRFLVHAAGNLARLFAALHAAGYVIGDVKSANFLVDAKAITSAVDTDSFQVRELDGTVHRCAALTPEYTPPEAQSRSINGAVLMPAHDLFGLWVLIFELLMAGYHPFRGGIEKQPANSVIRTDAGNIRAGISPFFTNSLLAPRPDSPRLEYLHRAVGSLFTRAFLEGTRDPDRRPSAMEWVNALDEAGRELKPCGNNRRHWYWPADRKTCMWCEIEASQVPAPRMAATAVPAHPSPVPLQQPWKGPSPQPPRRTRGWFLLALALAGAWGAWPLARGSLAGLLPGLNSSPDYALSPASDAKGIPVCPGATDVSLSVIAMAETTVEMRPDCWSGWVHLPKEGLDWTVSGGGRPHNLKLNYPDGSTFDIPEGHEDRTIPPSYAVRLRGNGSATVSILHPKEVTDLRNQLKAKKDDKPPILAGQYNSSYRNPIGIGSKGPMTIRFTRQKHGWLSGTTEMEDVPGICGRLYEVKRTDQYVIFLNRSICCGSRFLKVRPGGGDRLSLTWGSSPSDGWFDWKTEAMAAFPLQKEDSPVGAVAKAESSGPEVDAVRSAGSIVTEAAASEGDSETMPARPEPSSEALEADPRTRPPQEAPPPGAASELHAATKSPAGAGSAVEPTPPTAAQPASSVKPRPRKARRPVDWRD